MGEVVRLPTAAKRQVQNARYSAQRAAAIARRQEWPGEYIHHGQREARKHAAELLAIEPSPALLIAAAIYAALDTTQRVAVMGKLAPDIVRGVPEAKQAFAVLRAMTLNIGQQLDLDRALRRMREEQANG